MPTETDVLIDNEETLAALATDLDEQDIANLAFELWQARGCPLGSPEEDWFHAVELLRDGTNEG